MTDHCCAHPKCPGGSLCCCQGQPDPIERASDALYDFGIKDSRLAAQAAFGSIDTNQLADVILAANLFGDRTAMDAALAVKNWLTGKDTQ